MRENAKLKEVNESLKEQFKTTKFVSVDKKSLDQFTRKLLKDYQSGADTDKIRSSLDTLYGYIANGEDGHAPGWDTAYRMAYDTAVQVLEFQSTHPARGGTDEGRRQRQGTRYFNPPTPRGVGRSSATSPSRTTPHFNPPTPRGVGHRLGVPLIEEVTISIHPPREGWDHSRWSTAPKQRISIHPPREGWDIITPSPCFWQYNFNPPTPRGVGH